MSQSCGCVGGLPTGILAEAFIAPAAFAAPPLLPWFGRVVAQVLHLVEAFPTSGTMVRSQVPVGQQMAREVRVSPQEFAALGDRHGASYLWSAAGGDYLGTLDEAISVGLTGKGSFTSMDSSEGHQVLAASEGLVIVTTHIRLAFLEGLKAARVLQGLMALAVVLSTGDTLSWSTIGRSVLSGSRGQLPSLALLSDLLGLASHFVPGQVPAGVP